MRARFKLRLLAMGFTCRRHLCQQDVTCAGEGALFEFDSSKQWREKGRGEMRVNIAPRSVAGWLASCSRAFLDRVLPPPLRSLGATAAARRDW